MSDAEQFLSFGGGGDLSARLTQDGRRVELSMRCGAERALTTLDPVKAVEFADEVARLSAKAAVRPGWSVTRNGGVVTLGLAGAGPQGLSPEDARMLASTLCDVAARAEAGT